MMRMLKLASVPIVIAMMINPVSVKRSAAEPKPLHLEEVLAHLEERLPKVLSVIEDQRSSEALAEAALGHWDPQLQSKGVSIPSGQYEGQSLSATIEQATPLWGLSLNAGYRIGKGDFPSYKDYKTLSQGELAAGLTLPLLKGGSTDEGRAEIKRSSLLKQKAACQRSLALIQVSREASHVYWDWVAKGLLVKVQLELLTMAERRNEGLEERVNEGSLPPIILKDNERLVLERRGELIEANRGLKGAAYKLGIYHRDQKGEMIIAGDEELPQILPKHAEPREVIEAMSAEESILSHPLNCVLKQEISAAEVKVSLAETKALPQLDINAFVARDIGDGPQEMSPTEIGAGLTLKMPLLLRQARGELESARAKVRSLRFKLKQRVDMLTASLSRAIVNLEATHARSLIAASQVEVARALVEAERIKLEEGASDLIVLNLRELSYAKAEAMEIKAVIDYLKAHADYLSARGELGRAR